MITAINKPCIRCRTFKLSFAVLKKERGKKKDQRKDSRCNARPLNLSGVKDGDLLNEKFTVLLNYYSEQDPNKSSKLSL